MSEAIAGQVATGSLVTRLWRGDVPLWKTYWLFGALGGLALRLLSPIVTYGIASNSQLMSRFDIQILSYGWAAIVIFYGLFMLVAIWRSAAKYRVLKPLTKENATMAQIACVIGAISIAGSTISVFSADQDLLASKGAAGSADEKLQYAAMIAGLNADLPKKIDSVTTLTKIDVDDAGYHYYETISSKVDQKTFSQRMKKVLLTTLCKHQNIRDSLNQNVNFDYSYVDTNQNTIGKVIITKNDCTD